MKRYFCIVSGIVQGVGFRHFCTMAAFKHQISGTVRNMSNGLVEIKAQGTPEQFNDFIQEIQLGNRFIKIDNISIKEIPVLNNETKFKALYY